MRDTIWSIYFGDWVMHHIARARYQVDPLCEFLDVDVPDEPVPNVNDTEAFR